MAVLSFGSLRLQCLGIFLSSCLQCGGSDSAGSSHYVALAALSVQLGLPHHYDDCSYNSAFQIQDAQWEIFSGRSMAFMIGLICSCFLALWMGKSAI